MSVERDQTVAKELYILVTCPKPLKRSSDPAEVEEGTGELANDVFGGVSETEDAQYYLHKSEWDGLHQLCIL